MKAINTDASNSFRPPNQSPFLTKGKQAQMPRRDSLHNKSESDCVLHVFPVPEMVKAIGYSKIELVQFIVRESGMSQR